jgi:hypothetical protein
MLFNSTPNDASGAEWVVIPDSDFSTAPLAYLAECLLATEEYWGILPGVAPLFLREALSELLEATP